MSIINFFKKNWIGTVIGFFAPSLIRMVSDRLPEWIGKYTRQIPFPNLGGPTSTEGWMWIVGVAIVGAIIGAFIQNKFFRR